jgi:tetratricopeptide (TPR) repeat protein
MKSIFTPVLRVSPVWVLASIFAIASTAHASPFDGQDQKQNQSKDQLPQVSEDEQRALAKINAASGADAKLKAAAEYLKKYSKSQMRPRVAGVVADEIIAVKDSSQKIALAQSFTSTFNQPNEADMVKPALVEAYLNAGKIDEALKESSKYLEKNPDDIIMLTQLTLSGMNQAQKQAASPQLLQESSQAAAKATEMMETDKKPERMTPEAWNTYRNTWLPRIYQAHGAILYFSNDKARAKDKLEKAVGVDPYDPQTLLLLVNVSNEEYQELAKKYQAEKKPDTLNLALAKLDETIDWMARAVAATEGNAQFKDINQPLKENLKQYYEFRHEGKTDGMSELIQKYKKPQ